MWAIKKRHKENEKLKPCSCGGVAKLIAGNTWNWSVKVRCSACGKEVESWSEFSPSGNTQAVIKLWNSLEDEG